MPKAVHDHTPSRRDSLAAFILLPALAHVRGRGAPALPAARSNPDAELAALASAAHALTQEVATLLDGASPEQEAAREPSLDALLDRHAEVMGRLARTRPATLAGLRVKAAAIEAYDEPRPYGSGDFLADRLRHALTLDVLAVLA